MIAEFIKPEDLRWSACLEELEHDVYHLPEYARFASQFESGTPWAFYAEDKKGKCLIPLIVRPLPEKLRQPDVWCDATSPYGYPAPLLPATQDEEWVRRIMASFLETSRANNMISVFLRLNPLLWPPMGVLKTFGNIVRHGPTVYYDLNETEEDIWHDTRAGHRRHINKMKRVGFKAVIDDWRYFEEFKTLYRETMQRVDAGQYYFFDNTYFQAMRDGLGSNLHLCTVLAPNGEVSCGGLFMSCDKIVQYHLSGTFGAYLKDSPTKLMIDVVRRWAAEKGARYFHLGGGVGAQEDSLFKFKRGFSKTLSQFHTVRIIVSPERYNQCVQSLSIQQQEVTSTDYFPLYRGA